MPSIFWDGWYGSGGMSEQAAAGYIEHFACRFPVPVPVPAEFPIAVRLAATPRVAVFLPI